METKLKLIICERQVQVYIMRKGGLRTLTLREYTKGKGQRGKHEKQQVTYLMNLAEWIKEHRQKGTINSQKVLTVVEGHDCLRGEETRHIKKIRNWQDPSRKDVVEKAVFLRVLFFKQKIPLDFSKKLQLVIIYRFSMQILIDLM